MKVLLLTTLLLLSGNSYCQKQTLRGVAVYNTQSAMPFSKFGSLVSGIIHPGVEVSHRRIFNQKKRHDWFWDARASVFYHRFVQLGIPVSASIGYKYKLLKDLTLDASLGGGYLHSIPAAQKFKLDEQGEYKNNKGIGRSQAHVNVGLAINFVVNPLSDKKLEVFAGNYQMLQLPFIKSYVPILPYNQLMLGVRKQIK